MPADRCRPLKIESPSEGGSQLDYGPVALSPHQDGCDAAAYFLQSSTTADSTCYLDRDPADGGMRVTDSAQGTRRIPDLVSRSASASAYHGGLLDIIHYLDDGPGDAYASGLVRVRNGTAPNPLGWTWYTSSAQSKKVIAVTFVYPTGSILPSTKTWVLYATDGATPVRTCTDTLVWAGPLLASVTRVFS